MKTDWITSKRTEDLAMEKTWSAVRIRLGLESPSDRGNNTEHQIAEITGRDPVRQPGQSHHG